MSTDIPASSTSQVILPPYAADPRRRMAKFIRLLVFTGVGLFCLLWGAGFALFAPYLLLFFAAPIPIIAMVAIWALPDSRRPPLDLLASMLFLFMGCLVMWPNYIAFAPPGIPWITMTRLSGFPLVTILLVCASTSIEFRTCVANVMKSTPIFSQFFIAFLILEAVSIFYSISPVASFDSFINSQINLTAVFFVSVYVFLRPGRAERMIRLLWLMSILVGLIALVEFHEKHPPWANHIPSFLHIEDPIIAMELAGSSRGGVYRAQSTFGNALGLAEFGSLIIPFIINFMIGRYTTTTRVAAALTIPFILLVVFLTGSRLGLVGCFVSIVLTGVVWAAPRWANDRQSLLGPFVSILTPVFLLASALSTFVVGRIHAMVWGGTGGWASTYARTAQNQMAIPKLLSHPQGHGIGTGARALGFYTPGGFLTIDSFYVNVLMEFGFVGFILFYGMFILTVWQCAKTALTYKGNDSEIELLKPIGIAIVTFFIIKSVFAEQYNHPIVFMLIGLALAVSYRAREEAKAKDLAPAQLSQPVKASRRGPQTRATA